MRVAKLRIRGFRGISNGEFVFHQKTAIVGPNGCGKSTIVDALSLVLGKSRMVRNLTEHDFTGSCPAPSDRFTIVATIADFSSEDKKFVSNSISTKAEAGWGPFSFSGKYSHSDSKEDFESKFDGGSIVFPGLQLIAWIHTVPALSPPRDPK